MAKTIKDFLQELEELVDLKDGMTLSDVKKELENLKDPDRAKFIIEYKLAILQIRELRKTQKYRWNDFLRNVTYAILGGLLGILGGYLQSKEEKSTTINPVIIPKIQIVHETLYKSYPLPSQTFTQGK